jgi:hypothetical protein
MAVGVEDRPIYTHPLPAGAWALLWWLICRMDERCEVRGGWRKLAADEIGHHRISMQLAAKMLVEAGLIECEPRARYVKVLISRITG